MRIWALQGMTNTGLMPSSGGFGYPAPNRPSISNLESSTLPSRGAQPSLADHRKRCPGGAGPSKVATGTSRQPFLGSPFSSRRASSDSWGLNSSGVVGLPRIWTQVGSGVPDSALDFRRLGAKKPDKTCFTCTVPLDVFPLAGICLQCFNPTRQPTHPGFACKPPSQQLLSWPATAKSLTKALVTIGTPAASDPCGVTRCSSHNGCRCCRYIQLLSQILEAESTSWRPKTSKPDVKP